METLRAYGLKVFAVFSRHPQVGHMVAVRTTRRENEFAYTELLPGIDDPGNFATALDLMLSAIAARAAAHSGKAGRT